MVVGRLYARVAEKSEQIPVVFPYHGSTEGFCRFVGERAGAEFCKFFFEAFFNVGRLVPRAVADEEFLTYSTGF